MIFSSKQPVFNQFIYCYLNITVLSFYFIFEKRKPNFICSKCFLSFLIHIFMWLESKNRFYLLLETKEKKKILGSVHLHTRVYYFFFHFIVSCPPCTRVRQFQSPYSFLSIFFFSFFRCCWIDLIFLVDTSW